MEFAVNPARAAQAADHTGGVAQEFGALRQQFSSIVERAAEASGDLGVRQRILAFHDEWSTALTAVEHHGAGTGDDIAELTERAGEAGGRSADGFAAVGDDTPDASRISRAINGT